MSSTTTASSRSLNHSWAAGAGNGSAPPPPLASPRRPSAGDPLSRPLHVSTAEGTATLSSVSAASGLSGTTSGSPTSPGATSGPGSFHRMDSQAGSSFRDEDSGDDARGSTDTETKNLLDDGFSEGDSQSIADGEDPYQMTSEQRLYYTQHFNTLLQATGHPMNTPGGAIRGSDEKVKEFFQKSSLSQESLCKIWQLADVNQDGWLNLEEFCVSMHLIVLHVKGNLLIPDFLPPHIAPCVTPPRSDDAPSQPGWTNFESGDPRSATSSADLDGHPVATSPHSQMFTTQPPPVDRPIAQHRRPSHSPDMDGPKLCSTPRDFPDGLHKTYGNAPTPPRRRAVPPTDGPVPAATKSKTASLPLSPPSALAASAPKGPPPKPPPRPPHRSHGRSASLDLSKGGIPGVGIPEPSTGASATAASAPVPPSEPLPPPPLKDVETQTGALEDTDVGWSRARHSPPPMVDLEEEDATRAPRDPAASNASDKEADTYQLRVVKLRKANAELDKERARLAQLRLALELKLQNLHS